LDRIGPLVVLKLRLMFRLGKGAGPVVVLLLWLLGFIVPLSFTGALMSYGAFSTLDQSGDREFLYFVLFAVWVFWLVFPLVGFSLNQSYDLTKLFIYPISRLTIFVGNTLACFLDPTLLLVLPTFAVIIYYHAATALTVAVAVLALVLFLAHTLALSQALLWALLNILRSRRVRDWVVLLVPLIGAAVYLAPHLARRSLEAGQGFAWLLEWQPSRYLLYTPPGAAAWAIQAAARSRWLEAAGAFAGLLGYVALALGAGAFVLGRLHSGETGAYAAGGQARPEVERPSLLERLATTPLGALAAKELRYYWREPRYRSMFISPLFPLIVVLGGSFAGSHVGPGISPRAGVVLVGVMVLFGFSSLFQNMFGIDREGLRLLFASPCPRAAILMGKNAAAAAVAWVAASGAMLVAGFALGKPLLAATLLPFVFATAVVLAAAGNVVSIHFPVRVARRGENPFTSSSSRGCVNGLISALAFQVALLIAAPVFGAAAAPLLLRAPLANVYAAPLALLYAAGVYVAALRFYSVPALERQEMRIIEECLVGEPMG
jgi:ABC-2 type transport system permease protein